MIDNISLYLRGSYSIDNTKLWPRIKLDGSSFLKFSQEIDVADRIRIP